MGEHDILPPLLHLVESSETKHSFDEAAEEYVHAMVPHVVGQYLELGLHPAFAAIMGRHIDDLLLVNDVEAAESYLRVASQKAQPTHDWLTEPSDEVEWVREAVVSPRQHKRYLGYLAVATKVAFDFSALDRESAIELRKLSFDWMFFELSADAAASSCYMQQKFDKYVPDYNGQSPHFRTDLAISDNYLSSFSNGKPPISVLEADHIDLRAGMALIMLHDSLLRSNLGVSTVKARHIINQLSALYPKKLFAGEVVQPEPHTQTDIVLRLAAMEPRNPHRDMAEWLLNLDIVDQE